MANHLGRFPEASDGPEGQEQPVQAVGGQGELGGVIRLPCLLETSVFLTLGFWVWKIIWVHFQRLRWT